MTRRDEVIRMAQEAGFEIEINDGDPPFVLSEYGDYTGRITAPDRSCLAVKNS